MNDPVSATRPQRTLGPHVLFRVGEEPRPFVSITVFIVKGDLQGAAKRLGSDVDVVAVGEHPPDREAETTASIVTLELEGES